MADHLVATERSELLGERQHGVEPGVLVDREVLDRGVDGVVRALMSRLVALAADCRSPCG
jgi:hypothetical protein